MSVPPGQSPGSHGRQYQPPRQYMPPPQRRGSAWPRQCLGWSTVIGACCLLAVAGCAASATPVPVSPAPHSTVAAAAKEPPLSCHARAAITRPRDHTTVRIQIRTAAHAGVTVTAPLALASGQSATGRASADGTRALRLRVGDATPGAAVVIAVRVTRGDRTGTCQASFRPRPAPVIAVAAPEQPAASPSAAPAPPVAAPPPAPSAAACYPLSDEGTCYEPGEFCRDSDHGASGVAGDGEKIVCADNDGWRWEPA